MTTCKTRPEAMTRCPARVCHSINHSEAQTTVYFSTLVKGTLWSSAACKHRDGKKILFYSVLAHQNTLCHYACCLVHFPTSQSICKPNFSLFEVFFFNHCIQDCLHPCFPACTLLVFSAFHCVVLYVIFLPYT